MSVNAGFVDAGFLQAEGARKLKLARETARPDALDVFMLICHNRDSYTSKLCSLPGKPAHGYRDCPSTMLLVGKGNPDFILAIFSKMLVKVVFAMVC